MKRKLVYLLMFLCPIGFYAQEKAVERSFVGLEKETTYVEIKVSDGVYRIIPRTNTIIETNFIPKGENYEANSHALVSNNTVKFKVKKTKESIIIKTKGVEVFIQKSPFQVSYYYKGKKIISENKGYISGTEFEQLNFSITQDEVLYGTGERALGMNRRGHRLQLYNRAHYGYETHAELMNFTMPIVLSSNMYMLHFDNPQIGWIDLDSKKDNTLSFETIGGRKTYQVIVGDSWPEIIANYTNITGRQPLPPRWALGNFASRFGYHSEKETRTVVAAFKRDSIPLDAVILDLYWFGKDVQGTMGSLEFYRDSFPTPKKMIADFKEEGVKTILITEPFIVNTSTRWDEAVNEDVLAKGENGKPYVYEFYFGTTALVDIFKEKSRAWFWNIYKELIELGVAGWWGDLGEPEVHPKEVIHVNGTADEVHNIYGDSWARLLAEGYQKDFKAQRPFILMRSGYSGSQKHGMIPWSGDVNRTWGGLQSQMEISLQMGMQGMAYMHSDLGGFAGAYEDDELYIRWLQYGVFQPIYRPHAQEDLASEPVFKKAATKALAKQAIELRYRLLPYNYTLAYENSTNGMPLMRPLFFEEPNNEQLLSIAHTYLWGNDFLIHPVVNKGEKTALVYFPKANNWYDFYTGKKYKGGTTELIELKEAYIPTFVRGGAFIPTIETIQTTEAYSLDNFQLHYYYDDATKESYGKLYNDDGKTPYTNQTGKYELFSFESELEKESIQIEIENLVGLNYASIGNQIQLVIHGLAKYPKKIKIKDDYVEGEWIDGKLYLAVPFVKSEEIEIWM